MTNNNPNTERDEVLFAFHQACERPTTEQIIDWVRRYPQFAEDIRAHAAVARDWAARKELPAEEPDQSTLERGFSQVLNALYNAEVAASQDTSVTCQSFDQMTAARGTTIPQLARELDLKRSVIADLFNGGMLAPVGQRLVDAIVAKVTITRAAFDAAYSLARDAPRVGHPKADSTPAIVPRRYNDIIRDSGMSQERTRFWLGEDE
jgi:hypothetical protein